MSKKFGRAKLSDSTRSHSDSAKVTRIGYQKIGDKSKYTLISEKLGIFEKNIGFNTQN